MTDGHDPFDAPQGRTPLRAGAVAGDLEAIFASAGPTDGAAQPTASKVRSVGRRGARLPYATLGAVAAAGIVGLTAGSVASLRGKAPAPASAPTLARAATVVPVEVAATPPVSLSIRPAGPIPVLDTAPVTPRATAPINRRAAHDRPSDLLAADRRLRAAYSHAVRAGVSRHILVDYRNRWADLREDASWRPARVAAGYGEMSADLERMARRPNTRRPPGHSSLFDLSS
jgi:hypothetical protein